jgi:hypothetical protein
MDALPIEKYPLTTLYIHTYGIINETENYLNVLLVSKCVSPVPSPKPEMLDASAPPSAALSLEPEPELLDASSPSSVAPSPGKGLVQPDVEATA